MDKLAVLNFLAGVVEGIDEGLNFHEIEACIHDDEEIAGHIIKAVELFISHSKSDIAEALKELGIAMKEIPKAVQDCLGASHDVTNIIAIIESFANPGEFIFVVFKNLIIHGIEIYHEIKQGVDDFHAQKWEASGIQFGTAAAKIFLSNIMVTSPEYATKLNAIPSSWESTHYEKFNNMSLWDFKKCYLGTKGIKTVNSGEVVPSNDLPDNFDSRTKWPSCIHPIRDQGQCGSCWAFGASEALSDRFCIASNQSINTVLSSQYLVSCDSTDFGCNGGYLDHAWKFLENSGIVTEKCWSYKSGGGAVPKCNTFKSCEDGSPVKNYFVKKGTSKTFGGEAAIKNEIYTNGPIETGFTVYQDFMSYKSGIYEHKSGGVLGGHAVKIIGWGVEGGIKYWICANSWNTVWGDSGFFKIKQGQCGIDSNGIAGAVDLSK